MTLHHSILTSKIIFGMLASSLIACSDGESTGGMEQVGGLTAREGSPYQLEVRLYQFPPELAGMNHQTYGLAMGKDGYLYIGVGSNRENSHLSRYDLNTRTISDLGNFRDALPEDVYKNGNFGKFHVGPWQDIDGTVYFASDTREYWQGRQSGHLFKWTPDGGISDMGPLPDNQGAYFMHGDERHRRLYFATRDSHFSIYSIDSDSWQDKGKFTSKAPFIGLTDLEGRLYMYGYDGKEDWSAGPATISRYDPAVDLLETSRNAPPTLWVGALTPDHETAFTTSYLQADLYRWKFADWPDFKTENLGRIDPEGRPVDSNNLSLTSDGKKLVLAGTIRSKDNWYRGNIHGVWVFELDSGRKYLVAEINELLSLSLGTDSDRQVIYWTSANIVDQDGWIYIGIHTEPFDENSQTRLLAIRLHKS